MNKQFLLILTICFQLTSCVITPPSNSERGSKVLKSNLRSIDVECIEESICLNKAENELSTVVIYSNEECRLFDTASEVVATQTAPLECVDSRVDSRALKTNRACTAAFTTYVDSEGEAKVLVDEGEYSLIVFVDVNKNNFPDINEPYYCNDSVGVSVQKRLTSLSIEISRKLE